MENEIINDLTPVQQEEPTASEQTSVTQQKPQKGHRPAFRRADTAVFPRRKAQNKITNHQAFRLRLSFCH